MNGQTFSQKSSQARKKATTTITLGMGDTALERSARDFHEQRAMCLAVSPTSHSYGPTSFQSDRHCVLFTH